MNFVTGLRCVCCGATYTVRVGNTCPACGIGGILDVQYDYAAIGKRLTRASMAKRADRSHWRYRELLPIPADAALPPLATGWTPVTAAKSLGRHPTRCLFSPRNVSAASLSRSDFLH